MPSTADLVAALDGLLGPGSEELVASSRAHAVALALDPPPPASVDGCDAVLLHRPWGFEAPPGLGVVACHEPFDRRLGLARNRWLHAALGLARCTPLAPKATLHEAPRDVAARARAAFGALEREHGPAAAPGRVVLADAMTDDLVRAAARAGAELFVTGTWRAPGAAAVAETGVGVLVVGHERLERWSLHRLAGMLAAHGFATGGCMR